LRRRHRRTPLAGQAWCRAPSRSARADPGQSAGDRSRSGSAWTGSGSSGPPARPATSPATCADPGCAAGQERPGRCLASYARVYAVTARHRYRRDMAHEHMADLLDLDAEVLSEYHLEVAEWVAANLTERARVIDVGAGTGTGALALARQLPDAEVIALDVDEEMLKRIEDKARASGLADRIRTVQADLGQAWPDRLKPADLVWAANSLHHVGDPARAVAQIHQMLRPGGLLAVTELESFPRFLTDPAGAALEERIHTAMAQGRDEAGMHMHEDWPARFAEAGFTVESERRFVIALQPPPDSPMAAAVTRYATVTFCRARHGLQDKLSAGDIAE